MTFTLTPNTPVIEKFVNLKSKAVNETFTPGQIASITGLLLKFNEEDLNQGIFFISSDGTETRVNGDRKSQPTSPCGDNIIFSSLNPIARR